MLEHAELQTSDTSGARSASVGSPPRSATLFLLMVFGSTWLFQLPALLAERGALPGPRERFMPLIVLGFFAPAMFAIALSTLEGRAARRELWRPLTLWRVHPGWYVAALGLPCAILVTMRALAAAVGVSRLGPWLYPPTEAQQLAAMLIIPFTEQIAWRGYVYPRLQRTQGARLASLITGFAWGLFHVQKHAFIDPNATLTLALLTLAFMTSGTVVFSWIYLRTGGSLLLVVLANAGAYLNNSTAALPNTTPLALHTCGFCLCALGLLLFDRSAWRPRLSAAMSHLQQSAAGERWNVTE